MKRKNDIQQIIKSNLQIPYFKEFIKFASEIEKSSQFKKQIKNEFLLSRYNVLKYVLKVKDKFGIKLETFLISVFLFDFYISKHTAVMKTVDSSLDSQDETDTSVLSDEITSVALTCLFIASKFNEIYPPELKYVFSAEISIQEYMQIEKSIL